MNMTTSCKPDYLDRKQRVEKEIIIDIDVNDEVWERGIRGQDLNREEARTLLTNLSDSGCTTVMIRVGCLGLLPYHTDLTYPMDHFDVDHARKWYVRSFMDQGKTLEEAVKQTEDYIAARVPMQRQIFRKKKAAASVCRHSSSFGNGCNKR